MPLRVFTRRHYNVLEARGKFVVVGGWLVQAHGTPQDSINTFSYYYAYCVLIAYYIVWEVSEVRMTHPCLLLTTR